MIEVMTHHYHHLNILGNFKLYHFEMLCVPHSILKLTCSCDSSHLQRCISQLKLVNSSTYWCSVSHYISLFSSSTLQCLRRRIFLDKLKKMVNKAAIKKSPAVISLPVSYLALPPLHIRCTFIYLIVFFFYTLASISCKFSSGFSSFLHFGWNYSNFYRSFVYFFLSSCLCNY